MVAALLPAVVVFAWLGTELSRVDESITKRLKDTLALVYVRGLDDLIVGEWGRVVRGTCDSVGRYQWGCAFPQS